MNMYETVIILDGELTEEEAKLKEKEYLHKIVHSDSPEEDTITTYVHEIEHIGRRTLAYAIKGTHTTGYYIVYTYQTESERIKQLDRIMRIDDQVLKFITMKLDEESSSEIDTSHIIEEESMTKVATATSKSEQSSNPDSWDLIFGGV